VIISRKPLFSGGRSGGANPPGKPNALNFGVVIITPMASAFPLPALAGKDRHQAKGHMQFDGMVLLTN
jgi:hypothetical protein